MDVFIVRDAMILGRGVFGVFSTLDKAVSFKEAFEKESKYFCEINQVTIVGAYEFPNNVFAAHTYDELYDTHTLDGLYADSALAFDAVGEKGLVVEFFVDLPGEKQITKA